MSHDFKKPEKIPVISFVLFLVVVVFPLSMCSCSSSDNKANIQNIEIDPEKSYNVLTFKNWTPFCDKSSIVYIFNESNLGYGDKGREALMFKLGGLPAGSHVISYPVTSHDFPLADSWDGLHDSYNPAQDLFSQHANLFEQKEIKLSIRAEE